LLSIKNISSGFTLTELIISILLLGLVILAATSVEISSRRFFHSTEEQVAVQDEAKIAMNHMLKFMSQGIGSLDSPAYTLHHDDLIDIRIDGWLTGVTDGQYTGAPNDGTISYFFDSAQYRIVFDPNADPTVTGDEEILTQPIIQSVDFSVGSAPNQIVIEVIAREDPSQAASADNPQITLNSSAVLSAMSCN